MLFLGDSVASRQDLARGTHAARCPQHGASEGRRHGGRDDQLPVRPFLGPRKLRGPRLSDAVAFALLSLACAGLTDVVFKRYSRVDRSRGLYVLGIRITWTILQSAILLVAGNGLRLDAQTVVFGLGAGLVVAASNT